MIVEDNHVCVCVFHFMGWFFSRGQIHASFSEPCFERSRMSLNNPPQEKKKQATTNPPFGNLDVIGRQFPLSIVPVPSISVTTFRARF